MSRALAFAKGDLNPHNFLYPTFYFYVLFGWIGGYFAAGYALGLIPSVQAFQAQFFVDPTGVYLAGRALSVVCGLVTIGLVCAAGVTDARLAWEASPPRSSSPSRRSRCATPTTSNTTCRPRSPS